MVEAGRYYLTHLSRPAYLLPITEDGRYVWNPWFGPELPPEVQESQIVDRRSRNKGKGRSSAAQAAGGASGSGSGSGQDQGEEVHTHEGHASTHMAGHTQDHSSK
ncbi:hypothetical protein BGW41_008379, partial [Actinomortierella wolfii]